MKRTYRFVRPRRVVRCNPHSGTTLGMMLEVPVIPGIFKHVTVEELPELLADPVVLRKYTRELLRRAPWCALQWLPRAWLRECLAGADLPEARRRALCYLLDAS